MRGNFGRLSGHRNSWTRLPFLRPLLLLLAAAVCCPAQRKIEWTDLTQAGRLLASELDLRPETFSTAATDIDARTARRLREGEMDHLVYYLLQSRSFTNQPGIEPARSAVEYFSSQSISPKVLRRIEDLARALLEPADERQQYFATLVDTAQAEEILEQEYRRAMHFLHEKEVACRKAAQPQACVASIYQERGHSSDAARNANESVTAATEWVSKHAWRKIRRVLIIGPGTDFAPRTGLSDAEKPRVYQPQQVAAAVRSLGLAAEALTIDCIDINPRVLQYAAASCNIHLMNVVTNRPERPTEYDLIVATNVLLYMNAPELLLAFHNVRYMLAPRGLFIHNDARFETSLFGKAVGLPVRHFGTVTLDPQRTPVLLDRFAVHAAP